MTITIQEKTRELAKEAATKIEVVLDTSPITNLNHELLMEALGKIADIIVLNGE